MITIDQIKEDHKTARVQRDEIKSTILQTVLGELDRLTPENQNVQTVVKKLLMSNSECITAARNDEETHKLAVENSILLNYMPNWLTGTILCDFVAKLDLDSVQNKGRRIGIALQAIKDAGFEANGKEVEGLVNLNEDPDRRKQ